MCVCRILVVLVIVEAATGSVTNASLTEIDGNLLTRRVRKGGKDRSTSSSSGERGSSGSRDSDADSLEISVEKVPSGTGSDDSKETGGRITGWRKYHRVCPPCPEDMEKKTKDKSIRWICGGYQRARRTFKSLCMMRMRNCQDGTMFVKLYDGFCRAPDDGEPLGEHFFYDYKDDSESQDSTDKDRFK